LESQTPAGTGAVIAQELLDACARGDLEREDVVPNLFFLMSAGHETTASLISNSLLLYFDQPTLRNVLQGLAEEGRELEESHAAQWDSVLKEMLRVVTPVTRAYREVSGDFTYKGMRFLSGQQVQMHLAKANADADVFAPDPRRFRPDRSRYAGAKGHLAFGFRDHMCPGLNLGRMTTKAALTGGVFNVLRARCERIVVLSVSLLGLLYLRQACSVGSPG